MDFRADMRSSVVVRAVEVGSLCPWVKLLRK
jgi:hypothetical protein